MKKVFIFGTGMLGRNVLEKILSDQEYEVLGFIDNNKETWDDEKYNSYKIYKPQYLENIDFDYVITALINGFDDVLIQLEEMKIPQNKIDTSFVEMVDIIVRPNFIKQFSIFSKMNNLEGNVAEAGVFQGEISKYINRYFNDKKLYLFDTFEGFDNDDIKIENEISEEHTMFTSREFFVQTSEELVMSKMEYPANCVIKKGYFPETVDGLEDKKFCFVSLDMDLYKPTLEGLRFFYPRMVEGGCILIHDYFTEAYPKIKISVSQYEEEIGFRLHKLPIGDNLSIAIIK